MSTLSQQQLLAQLCTSVSLVTGQLTSVVNKVDIVAQNQTVHMGFLREKRTLSVMEVPTSPQPNTLTVPVVTPESSQKRLKQALSLHIQSPTAPAVQVPIVLSETTISTLFFEWYSKRIYATTRNVDNRTRDALHVMGKLICFCKRFLPRGANLRHRPPPTDMQRSLQWVEEVRAYSVTVEEALVGHIAANVSCTNRSREPKVYSSLKACMSIPLSTYPALHATDETIVGSNWGFFDIVAFKRL